MTTSTAPKTPTTVSTAEPEPGDAAAAEPEPADAPGTSATTLPDLSESTDSSEGTDLSEGTDSSEGTDLSEGTDSSEGTDLSEGTDSSEGTDLSNGSPSGEIPWVDVLGGLNAAEQSCIRERFDEAGFGVVAEADRISEPALAQAWDLVFSLLECLPDPSDFGSAQPGGSSQPGGSWTPEAAEVVNIGEALEDALDEDVTDLFVFEAVEGEVYEIGVAPGTLVDPTVTLYDADGSWLGYDDDSGGSLAPLLSWSADGSGPLYVEVGGWDGAGSYTLTVAVSDISDDGDMDDDHADSSAGATAVAVGEAVEGVLDYDGDVDFFVFEAVDGEVYEIFVALGTLGDPTVTLYDADGLWLGYDDVSGGSLAPQLFWSADGSGPLYVEVGGWDGAGSYTLTVAVLDVDDDHAGSLAGATAVAVGDAVEGVLGFGDDVDFFVFEAVEGEVYEIGVAPGTLEDPTVTLYDADGLRLGADDNSGGSLAPRLFWSADGSGPLHVQVGGYDDGSYTLTVAVADVDDDHADWLAGATAAEVGEAVEGVLDHDGDVDFFVFEAVEGEIYEMGVGPGTVMRALDGGCLAVGAMYEMGVAPGILADPATVTLYDADGVWLDSDSPCLYWRAATTGPLYVEVRGYGSTGSYTLKIAR